MQAPAPQVDAPCGVVDTLDFPLDPPDGAGARGGGDFGRYSSRYGLYHAGEDWSFRSRSASLGKPVHSIGHGIVTYAQPLGWGLDQGVVIVRHVFPDGATVLSFYGHLDPESVVLRAGDCVARGDIVGRIGKPRTSPHLHFEIRTHSPTEPGRGYSAQDPALAGWLAPSAFIWQQRIAASPGVVWMRPATGVETRGIGLLDENTFLVAQEIELVAIDVRDGSERWRYTLSLRLYDAMIHPESRTVLVSSVFGAVQALRGTAAAPPLEPLWESKFDDIIFPTLMPLPGAGAVLATRRTVIALSAAGHKLWEHEAVLLTSNWVLASDRLVVAGASGDIWLLDREGAATAGTDTGGRLAPAGSNTILTYDEQGIHRLYLETGRVEQLYDLPGGFPGYGDLALLQPDALHLPGIAAPGDRLLTGRDILATHRDAAGDSLIALASDGALFWRRSLERALREQRSLYSFEGRAYLVSHVQDISSGEISLYEIDLKNAELIKIFVGGNRDPAARDTWLAPIDKERFLIHIGGVGLALLDTQAALVAVQAR